METVAPSGGVYAVLDRVSRIGWESLVHEAIKRESLREREKRREMERKGGKSGYRVRWPPESE